MAHKWELFFIAMLAPMIFWMFLAIVARRRPALLPALYPWLTALCWALWIASLVLMVAGLLAYPRSKMFLWPMAFVSYCGLKLVHAWVKRRVDSDAGATASRNGWWPAPRNL